MTNTFWGYVGKVPSAPLLYFPLTIAALSDLFSSSSTKASRQPEEQMPTEKRTKTTWKRESGYDKTEKTVAFHRQLTQPNKQSLSFGKSSAEAHEAAGSLLIPAALMRTTALQGSLFVKMAMTRCTPLLPVALTLSEMSAPLQYALQAPGKLLWHRNVFWNSEDPWLITAKP